MTIYSATPKKIPIKRFKNRHTILRIDTAVHSVPISPIQSVDKEIGLQSRDHDLLYLLKGPVHRPIQRSEL